MDIRWRTCIYCIISGTILKAQRIFVPSSCCGEKGIRGESGRIDESWIQMNERERVRAASGKCTAGEMSVGPRKFKQFLICSHMKSRILLYHRNRSGTN